MVSVLRVPKCILWSPARGGRRLSKKASMADVVKARLQKWEVGDMEQLWKDALARSSRPLPQEQPKKSRMVSVSRRACCQHCVWAM